MDADRLYVNLEVTRKILLDSSSGLLTPPPTTTTTPTPPPPEAVLRVFVDLAAVTSILEFTAGFYINSNTEGDDDTDFCFVVSDDGYLVLTVNESNLVNPSNSSQLVLASDSVVGPLAYV